MIQVAQKQVGASAVEKTQVPAPLFGEQVSDDGRCASRVGAVENKDEEGFAGEFRQASDEIENIEGGPKDVDGKPDADDVIGGKAVRVGLSHGQESRVNPCLGESPGKLIGDGLCGPGL